MDIWRDYYWLDNDYNSKTKLSIIPFAYIGAQSDLTQAMILKTKIWCSASELKRTKIEQFWMWIVNSDRQFCRTVYVTTSYTCTCTSKPHTIHIPTQPRISIPHVSSKPPDITAVQPHPTPHQTTNPYQNSRFVDIGLTLLDSHTPMTPTPSRPPVAQNPIPSTSPHHLESQYPTCSQNSQISQPYSITPSHIPHPRPQTPIPCHLHTL